MKKTTTPESNTDQKERTVSGRLHKFVMTDIEAEKAKSILKETSSWEELADNFPSFSEAVGALPDTTLLFRCNVILINVALDAICRAKGLPDGTFNYLA